MTDVQFCPFCVMGDSTLCCNGHPMVRYSEMPPANEKCRAWVDEEGGRAPGMCMLVGEF